MITQLSKEINSSYFRLLNHKAFAKGEVDIFLNNFELQRNDQEVENLFKAAEIAGELKSELSRKCLFLVNTHLQTISDALKTCLDGFENFQRIIEKEEPNNILVVERQKRDKYRTEFTDNLAHKYNCIKNTFEDKEEEIIELYSDLERKLNIQK